MLSTSEIKKRLINLAGLIADQSAKDSDFAAAVSALFSTPSLVADETDAAPEQLLEASFDPFVVWQDHGADGFRNWIDTLSIEQLKAIISEHRLDATGNARKWKTKGNLVNLIIDRVDSRSKQGGVFRRYGDAGNADVAQ